MRYLSKREDFLKEKQHIKGVNYTSIYEASNAGPFANDVGWNDSLLGRLINHVIRKSKIAAKVPTIKRLVERLKAEFDQIVGQSSVYNLPEEDQRLKLKIELDKFFKELIFAVENKNEVSVLKGLTDGCISNVTSMQEFDKKSILLEELKKFREFLNQFNDNESVESSEETPAEEEKVPVYGFMVKNLKSLSTILLNYKKVNLNNTTAPEKSNIYVTKAGDTLVKIENDVNINTKKLDISTIRSKNPGKLDKYKQDNNELAPGIKILMEENTFGTGASTDRNNIGKTEDHLTQAFTKLKSAIDVLVSSKEKGISVDYNFINDIVLKSNDSKNKELIKQLYNEINRYLVGDKKGTIQDKDVLYKEGIEILSEQNKLVIVAEKIARFAKRALQFEKENLLGGLGDLKVPLQTFVSTIHTINKTPLVTPKKESVFTYLTFLENIDSNTTETTEVQKDEKDIPNDNKILEFFNENCKEVKNYTVSSDEVTSLSSKIKPVDGKEGIILTMDPIIEIMNLFIRAYKTYTVRTITKRSENVDTNTLSEYTSFGTGEDNGKSGPYRNNKLFNIWEAGVNDIRKDRKYQAIFTDNAKLRLPKVTDPDISKPDDWVIKPKAGSSFRQFINDMLDGEKLYKSGTDAGKVSVFVEKYFGDGTLNNNRASKDIDIKTLSENADIESEISQNAIKLHLGKLDLLDPVANTFITIDGKGPSKTDKETFNRDVQRSFFIDKVQANFVWIISTVHLKRFNPYLDLLSPKREISQGDFPRTISNDKSGELTYTKISIDDFKKLKAGQKISLITVDSKGAQSTSNIQIVNVYSLKKEDNDAYVLDDTIRTKFDDILTKSNVKFDVKPIVDAKPGTEIKLI